jgi:hypothetical protein
MGKDGLRHCRFNLENKGIWNEEESGNLEKPVLFNSRFQIPNFLIYWKIKPRSYHGAIRRRPPFFHLA